MQMYLNLKILSNFQKNTFGCWMVVCVIYSCLQYYNSRIENHDYSKSPKISYEGRAKSSVTNRLP